MSRVPEEASSWADPPDPEATARQLREQLDAAKARMREHRETIQAAGLNRTGEDKGPAA